MDDVLINNYGLTIANNSQFAVRGTNPSGALILNGGMLGFGYDASPWIRSELGIDVILDAISPVPLGSSSFTLSVGNDSGANYPPGTGTSFDATEIFRVSSSGYVYTSGDVTPTASGSDDLGSPTKP